MTSAGSGETTPSSFNPSKVLADVKRRIASQRHACLPSRVRVPTLSEIHNRSSDKTFRAQRHQSWLAHAAELHANGAKDSTTPTSTYYSVPELLAGTAYTAADVWKDARTGLLDVEVQAVHGTRAWIPVTTYLSNVKQQCACLCCVVHLPDTPELHITFEREQHPQLTLLDVCAQLETRVPALASGPEATTWAFALHDNRSGHVLNTFEQLNETGNDASTNTNHTGHWWTMQRFRADTRDYSTVHHLTVHPIAKELLVDDAVVESIGMRNSRKAHADRLRRARDAALREQQDAEYRASLEADRRRAASTTKREASPVSPVAPVTPVAPDTPAAEPARPVNAPAPLSREDLRRARQQYFQTRFSSKSSQEADAI